MKENVEELTRLFTNGKTAHKKLSVLYDKLVPTRWPDYFQATVRTNSNGWPTVSGPKELPESRYTSETLETTRTTHDSWVADVNTALDKIGKARYKMQFADPTKKESPTIQTPTKTTRNEDDWSDILEYWELELGELRRIIIDYETSSEQEAKEVVSQDIEPATYDPKTKTIFFANEAIRFTKSAEYSPAICRLMFENPDKQWELKDFLTEWDSLYDYLPDLQKPSDWNKVYAVINKMNDRVQKATGVPDLFKLSTKSVRLNPRYITRTKK